jgi:hypothetical protein
MDGQIPFHWADLSVRADFMESVVKSLAKFVLLIAVAATSVVPASAAPICLRTYLIDRTKVIDAKTVDFRMRDGTVYRNVLRNSCPGLLFNGFVYVVRADEVCDNLQSIRVLQTPDVCLLGAFTKQPPATPQASY